MEHFDPVMVMAIAVFVLGVNIYYRRWDRTIEDLVVDREPTRLSGVLSRYEPWLRIGGLFGLFVGLVLLSMRADIVIWLPVFSGGLVSYIAAPMWHLLEWKR